MSIAEERDAVPNDDGECFCQTCAARRAAWEREKEVELARLAAMGEAAYLEEAAKELAVTKEGSR
jgi:hypothetical protein